MQPDCKVCSGASLQPLTHIHSNSTPCFPFPCYIRERFPFALICHPPLTHTCTHWLSDREQVYTTFSSSYLSTTSNHVHSQTRQKTWQLLVSNNICRSLALMYVVHANKHTYLFFPSHTLIKGKGFLLGRLLECSAVSLENIPLHLMYNTLFFNEHIHCIICLHYTRIKIESPVEI